MKKSPQHLQIARQQNSLAASNPSLERHRRKCAICRHPDREDIEDQFVHWRSPSSIADDFNLEDRRIVYRHASATGLYEARRKNYIFTIENVLECGEDIEFTAAAYIKAVRAYASLCDTVRWVEPATRVTYKYDRPPEPPSWEQESAPAPSPNYEPPIADRADHQPASEQTSPAIRTQYSPNGHEPARPASSIPGNEQFLAATIPVLGAKRNTVAQLKKAGLLHLAELATGYLRPAKEIPSGRNSNRHIPELESRLSHRKQRSEVTSNRHKNTK